MCDFPFGRDEKARCDKAERSVWDCKRAGLLTVAAKQARHLCCAAMVLQLCVGCWCRVGGGDVKPFLAAKLNFPPSSSPEKELGGGSGNSGGYSGPDPL